MTPPAHRPFYVRKRFWGVALAAAILFLLFHNLDFARFWSCIRSLAWWMLPLATGCQFVMMSAKAERWRLLLLSEANPRRKRMFTLYVVGYLLNITLPALTGQVGRVYLLSRREKVSTSFATATVSVEVLADALAIILLVLVASAFMPLPAWLVRTIVIVAASSVLLAVVLVLIAHRNPALLNAGRWFARLFPERFYSPIRKLFHQFRSGLSTLRHTEHSLLVLALSGLGWIAQSAGVFVVLAAFDLHVPVYGAVLVMIVNTLMVIFPITPANVGTFEFATMSTLSLFDVPAEAAAAFALVLHFTDIVPPYVFGLVALASEGVSIRSLGGQMD